MTKKTLNKSLLSLGLCVMLLLSSIISVFASVSPSSLTAELASGESVTEKKTVDIPAVPPKADIVFAFDCTGSMSTIINTAKAQSVAIMNMLDAIPGVDIDYGVMSYMDYAGTYNSYGYYATYGYTGSDYPYKLNQPVTSNNSAVAAAINGLNLGSGADGPQDYTRIFYESYADAAINWREGSKKIVINFGDNVPHDNNLNEGILSGTWSTGGDPGRDNIILNDDDLDLQTVLAAMASNNITLLECHTTTYSKNYWDYWTGITGGCTYTTGSSTLADDIATAVNTALSTPMVTGLTLQASSGFEAWLTSVVPASYSGPTGVSTAFDIVITVPDGTAPGNYNFEINAVDNAGINYGSQDVSITVKPNNTPPVAEAGGPYTADEGTAITFDGSGSSDPDGDAIQYRWDVNNDGIWEGDWSSIPTFSYIFDDNFTGTAKLEVKDSEFTVSDTASVTVNNVAPDVGDIEVSVSLVPVGTSINATASFTDPGILDIHTANWVWGDGSSSDGSISETNGTGTASDIHIYTTAGVYTIEVTVTDDDGGNDTSFYQYVIVYDPSAGFVTGGGWINSPAGAYYADLDLTGEARFGFVSKYQKGAKTPTGVTQFQFQVADLNFHSNSYDWLVIAGDKAMFKGTGTINGEGEYGFLLSAIDGDPDMFRIKIWDKATDTPIYDNQLEETEDADPSTELGGGSIVIHK